MSLNAVGRFSVSPASGSDRLTGQPSFKMIFFLSAVSRISFSGWLGSFSDYFTFTIIARGELRIEVM